MDDLLAMVEHPDPLTLAEATLIQFDPPGKTKYLSYRVCGFSITEAQKISQISYRTRMRWRAEDQTFAMADDHAGQMQKDMANKYIEIEFRRNMRLVLELDYRVLVKCTEKNPVFTPREQSWLNRLRQHYTPQQMVAMAEALGEAGDGKTFDFTKFVLGISRGADKLVIAGSRGE